MTIEMIQENDNFRFFHDDKDGKNVFEILDPMDHQIFQQGMKKGDSRFWRNNETTAAMLTHMNSHRARNFVVRYDGNEMQPVTKGF